jgi:hypothetical protein
VTSGPVEGKAMSENWPEGSGRGGLKRSRNSKGRKRRTRSPEFA